MEKEIIDIKKTTNQYAVKLIQGKLYEGSKTMPISPGIYFTSVNIHYPGPEKVSFHVKIALSGLNGHQGIVTKWREFVLENDYATEFDSIGFQSLLGSSFVDFNEGFFVIECRAELDVVGVYTGSTSKEFQLSTMHMERVAKRTVIPGKY
jgi:hypothetical protein